MVYKSVDMESCGRFVFYNNIYFFPKNQKQNRYCVTCYVIFMGYNSRSISALGFTQLL